MKLSLCCPLSNPRRSTLFLPFFWVLVELRMSMNKFSGTLGTEFKSLVDLEVLQLNDNKFTGSIPNSFDHSLRMSDINLKNNQLSGKIPKSITHLVGLSK